MCYSDNWEPPHRDDAARLASTSPEKAPDARLEPVYWIDGERSEEATLPRRLERANDATFDNLQSAAKGWGIFDGLGSENGRWQLRRRHNAGLVSDDHAAWHFVFLQAREGSAYHQSALGFLKHHNPQEYGAIQGYVTGLAAGAARSS